MRQGGLAVSGPRDAGVGAHRRTLLSSVGAVGQSAAPPAGSALLMLKTLELTCDLMSRASVSPVDGGCQALMAERLAAIGFSAEHLRFGPGGLGGDARR